MPTDKTTPEDVEAANAVAAATEREAKAQKEIAKAIEKMDNIKLTNYIFNKISISE